jgi:hypothetical protein
MAAAAAAVVSHSCACIGSPCLRHGVHGASIGGGRCLPYCWRFECTPHQPLPGALLRWLGVAMAAPSSLLLPAPPAPAAAAAAAAAGPAVVAALVERAVRQHEIGYRGDIHSIDAGTAAAAAAAPPALPPPALRLLSALRRCCDGGDGGESFLRVHWVAVPQALRARRANRRRRRRR